MDYFFKKFREEHRIIRDLLLDLITAFLERDMPKAGKLLSELNAISGPHFRYEEEALYPSLVQIFGEPYINKLMTDHDLAITRAKKLKTIIEKGKNTKEDYLEGLNHIRAILPHVSDCEGLTIMVEKLPEPKLNFIIQTMDSAIAENIPLLEWAGNGRGRKALRIN
jgi:hemerythrin